MYEGTFGGVCELVETEGERITFRNWQVPWFLGFMLSHGSVPVSIVIAPGRSNVLFSINSYVMYPIYLSMVHRIQPWLLKVWNDMSLKPPYPFYLRLGEHILLDIDRYDIIPVFRIVTGPATNGLPERGLLEQISGTVKIYREIRYSIRELGGMCEFDSIAEPGKGVPSVHRYDYSVFLPPRLSKKDLDSGIYSSIDRIARTMAQVGIVVFCHPGCPGPDSGLSVPNISFSNLAYELGAELVNLHVTPPLPPIQPGDARKFLLRYLNAIKDYMKTYADDVRISTRFFVFGRVFGDLHISSIGNMITTHSWLGIEDRLTYELIEKSRENEDVGIWV